MRRQAQGADKNSGPPAASGRAPTRWRKRSPFRFIAEAGLEATKQARRPARATST